MANTTGKTGWIDMTADDADGLRDYYKAVVGWEHADVEASAEACGKHCGAIIVPIRGLAGGRSCVIRDPARATAALYQP